MGYDRGHSSGSAERQALGEMAEVPDRSPEEPWQQMTHPGPCHPAFLPSRKQRGEGQPGFRGHVERQMTSLRIGARRGPQHGEEIRGQPPGPLPSCVHGKDGMSSSPASSSSETHNASPSPPADLTVMEPSAVRCQAGTLSHTHPLQLPHS